MTNPVSLPHLVDYAPPGATAGTATMRFMDAVYVASVYGDLEFLSLYGVRNCMTTRLRPGVGRPMLCKSNSVYVQFHSFKSYTNIAVYDRNMRRLLDAGRWTER